MRLICFNLGIRGELLKTYTYVHIQPLGREQGGEVGGGGDWVWSWLRIDFSIGDVHGNNTQARTYARRQTDRQTDRRTILHAHTHTHTHTQSQRGSG